MFFIALGYILFALLLLQLEKRQTYKLLKEKLDKRKRD